MPERIQLSRAKGWRMPPNTVKVDRSTRWGNPYRVVPPEQHGRWKVFGPGHTTFGVVCGNEEGAVLVAIRLFKQNLELRGVVEIREGLRGKSLACWCKPGAPCHADVLLEIANA